MRRREFIIGIIGSVWALSARAEQAGPKPSEAQTVRRKRLAYLSGGSPGSGEFTIDILKASLRDFGWRIGETIDIEERVRRQII